MLASKPREKKWKLYWQNLSPKKDTDRLMSKTLDPFLVASFDPIKELLEASVAPPSIEESPVSVLPPKIKTPSSGPVESIQGKAPGSETLPPVEIKAPLSKAIPEASNTLPFPYAYRVLRWRECLVEGTLDREIFWEYEQVSPTYEKWMKISHGFSFSADRFHAIGIKTTWQNVTTHHEDTLYIVPAD